MILLLRQIDYDIRIEPEDAIFRINSDIRFSKDKAPYKPWMSANISALGKKGKDFPGFFIQINHKKIVLAGGVYNPDKTRLHCIREQIMENPDEFIQAIRSPEFISNFSGIISERQKNIPSDFKFISDRIPEMHFKQFYFRRELNVSCLLAKDLTEQIKNIYSSASKLHIFLRKAYKNELVLC
jgi:uncharacterized protein (TIGR02453 family)